ncbi:MAG: GH1 family beta-glucosidase [Candidatus Latescibacteria bacterium]|nr:GH1 family beta-glucosidase [Candidatus Latescibacterota bacterium]
MTPGNGFPAGFLWGAATSAYQIEGSPLADGAGPSNWHVFSHTPGCTHDGDTGDVACDHYRLWRQDLDLMAGMGLNAYRFSVAWSRVQPDGRGAVNPAGLAFYDRLVDALLERSLAPNLTLYHWDLPAALEEAGGWTNPEIVDRFAQYARILARALGDRVAMWSTLNEPWVVVNAGYLHGVHAPGRRDPAAAMRAAHHLLLGHGAAVRAVRDESPRARVGIVVNIEPKYPASTDPADVAATARADAAMNRLYLDPLLLGRYPEEMPAIYGDAWPDHPAGDFALIREPLDFLGVNYYTRAVVRHDDDVPFLRAAPVPQPDVEHTDLAWEVHPASLTRTLLWLRERYGSIPLYITENGAAFPDPDTSPPEGLDDRRRVAYFRGHLRALREAIAHGSDVRGYFAWSLLDNFEWACGYAKRFGIVHVDFATQMRTPKASARYYAEVVRTNGAEFDAPEVPQ